MPRLKTFSLYLAKVELSDFDDLLTESARALVKSGVAKKSTSDEFGDGSVLNTFPAHPHVPKWPLNLGRYFHCLKTYWRNRPVPFSPSGREAACLL
jgi:hypothetical protein